MVMLATFFSLLDQIVSLFPSNPPLYGKPVTVLCQNWDLYNIVESCVRERPGWKLTQWKKGFHLLLEGETRCNVEGISASSRINISTLMAVRVYWINSCSTMILRNFFSVLRENEQTYCSGAGNTISTQWMVISSAISSPNASSEQYVVAWEEWDPVCAVCWI